MQKPLKTVNQDWKRIFKGQYQRNQEAAWNLLVFAATDGAGELAGPFIRWGTKKVVTLAAEYTVRLAVENPSLTINEARAMVNVPKVAAMMEGKGIDRAFREIARRNIILNPAEKLGLIKLNPMNRGADMIGKGLLNGTWWDVTTEAAWGAHVTKYGDGGMGLFY